MLSVIVSNSKKKEHENTSSNTTTANNNRGKKSKKYLQDSKFPATDGVSLEYFLSEISDDDSSSW